MHRSLIVAVVLALALPAGAAARTFKVTEHDDHRPGRCTKADCTLREAIIAANDASGPDTVELPGHRRYELSRESTGEDASADGDLDITSAGTLVLHRGFGRRVPIDANGIDRVFDIHAAAKIRGVAIRGGSAHAIDGGGDGGGVLTDSKLMLKNTRIVDNRTTVFDGNGGGIDTDATAPVQIRNSIIVGNYAVGDGGGVTASIDGPTRIDQTRIIGNQAGEGAGLMVVGAVNVTRSTLADNHSVSGPDGELGDGGGIYVDDQGALSMENTTITGNTAVRSGAGVFGETGAIAAINSTTITSNRADADDAGDGTSGGVHTDDASFEIVNSIIALNTTTAAAASDCGGSTYTGTAPNLISTAAGGCGPGSELIAADPLLGPLADNGGETPTIALLPGSPALDAADSALAPERDQRATPRDDGAPDLGAFEL